MVHRPFLDDPTGFLARLPTIVLPMPALVGAVLRPIESLREDGRPQRVQQDHLLTVAGNFSLELADVLDHATRISWLAACSWMLRSEN
jgi:hypothetical protein